VDHRGIQYQVVQTANPTGWKWTVQLDGKRPKTGKSGGRMWAVHCAKSAIEKVIQVRQRAEKK
jgi:hypothetical protein